MARDALLAMTMIEVFVTARRVADVAVQSLQVQIAY